MAEATDVAPNAEQTQPVELPKEVKLAAEEGLSLRNIEVEFLKAQATAERAQRATQDLNKAFAETVEGLVTKYGIDKDKYTFNSIQLAFIRK